MSGGHDAGGATGPGPSGVKRKRTARVTSGQIDALLAKLEARPHLFTRKFTGLQGRENFEEGWKEVTVQLNQLPNGSVKTTEQWMTVWRDLKSRACAKAARLRQEVIQTGNRAVTTAPLTEVEKRIVSLVGGEYTLGTECPDSMPVEFISQNDNEVVLTSEVPRGDASEVISLPFTPYSELELTDVEDPSGSRVIVTAGASTPPPPTEIIITPRLSPLLQISVSHTPQPAPTRPRSTRSRNLNPRRSVAEQYSSARENFMAIAASNAEAMKMLGTAAMKQAEAANLHGEAMKELAAVAKLQAEATKMHAEAMMKFADAAKTQAQTNITLASAIEKFCNK